MKAVVSLLCPPFRSWMQLDDVIYLSMEFNTFSSYKLWDLSNGSTNSEKHVVSTGWANMSNIPGSNRDVKSCVSKLKSHYSEAVQPSRLNGGRILLVSFERSVPECNHVKYPSCELRGDRQKLWACCCCCSM